MIKEREIPKNSEKTIEDISAAAGVSYDFAKILVSRGIDTVKSAVAFLNPDLKDLQDPFALKGMREAVNRIHEAKESGETVVIYGDYDADGISAVAVLYKCLKIFGIEAYAVIPERKDGYGLTEGVYEQILEEISPDLIITVDCGISAANEVEDLKDLGVDVIITDHHEIPDVIPDCIVVDCHLKGEVDNFEYLCGAGVAYKLGYCLIGEKANAYLDMVAIATIADSMPLIGENRILVSKGIEIFKSGNAQKCLKILAELSEIKEYTAHTLTYSIAPRINAAGRMGDAYSALQLFLSDDVFEMRTLAAKLNDYNVKRQAECDLLYKSAKQKIALNSSDKAIIIYDEGWNKGLIGIVAARLVEEYRKPVIMFSLSDGVLHGSARSVANINIFDAINSVKDLTESFGGHSQAAGVTLKYENLELFKNRLNEYLSAKYDISVFLPKTEVDMIINKPFTLQFARELKRLEPCGVENKRPSFAVACEELNAAPLKYGSPHLSIKTDYIDLLWFGGVDNMPILNSPLKKYLIFEPNISVYMGNESLRGFVNYIEICAEQSEKIKIEALGKQLKDIPNKNVDYRLIEGLFAENLIKQAEKEVYGTLFIVNDFETITKFDLSKFEICANRQVKKGNVSAVCYGLTGDVPDGYNKVVYLDKPLAAIRTDAEVFVNTDHVGFKDNLSTDRQIFGEIYLAIKHGNYRGSFEKIAFSEDFGQNPAEVLFALYVFEELGLVYYQGNLLKVNSEKRVDLASSKIYNAVADYE